MALPQILPVVVVVPPGVARRRFVNRAQARRGGTEGADAPCGRHLAGRKKNISTEPAAAGPGYGALGGVVSTWGVARACAVECLGVSKAWPKGCGLGFLRHGGTARARTGGWVMCACAGGALCLSNWLAAWLSWLG